jgi:hypothetical protein
MMLETLNHWAAPQWIVVALLALVVTNAIVHHGRQRTPVDAAHTIISWGLWSSLLAWGGFFR